LLWVMFETDYKIDNILFVSLNSRAKILRKSKIG